MSNRLLTAGAFAVCLTLLPDATRADENTEKPTVSTPAVTVAPVSTPAVNVEPPAKSETPAGVSASDKGDATAKADSKPSDAAEPVMIDYNEADIQSALRTLATRAGINLIMGDEVTGKVTVHLEGVSYEDAIQLIVESKGYAYVKDKNVARIKSKESLESEPLEVRVQTLNYAKADDIRKTLEPVLTKRGKIQVDARSNTLIFSDTPSNLAKVIPLLETLDLQTPQVMIEAKFVETTKNPKKDLGINWSGTLLNHEVSVRRPTPDKPVDSVGNPSPLEFGNNLANGQWTYPTAILDVGSFNVVLSYLNSDSDTELLANPRVVTADNSKAKIAIATQYPIPTFTYSETKGAFTISGFEFKDIGIVLNVTPRINKNEFVTLDVAPEAGSQSGVANFQGVSIPIVDNRSASTTVLIKSGNTLAIGGLMRQDTTDQYTKVPVLGDLPGLGALFRSKSLTKTKRDLLIFVTPTIVNPESQTGYEQYIGGLPAEELFTRDKWLPKDNAKPNSASLKELLPQRPNSASRKEVVPSRKSPSQNFVPK